MNIKEGQEFPDFELNDQDGNSVSLADLKGQQWIIYFYPKDDTSGCTAQACEFRDLIPSVEGVRVLGISPDDQQSHRKFATKYNLNFALLTDRDHQLAEELGLWIEKSLYGRKYMGVDRTTFLIDTEGKVAKIWTKVKPTGHAAEVQAALAERR